MVLQHLVNDLRQRFWSSVHILSVTVTTQKQSNWNSLLRKRHSEEILLKKLQLISLFAQPSISKSPSFSKYSKYSMKSAARRYAVHKGVKNSFSGLIYFFPNVHLRFVILKEVQVTLLLPCLQIALLFFKTVLANGFCNSLSMSDHQSICWVFRVLCFLSDSLGCFS